MDRQSIEKLLASPFETDRIKVIYYAVKNKRVDLFELMKKTSETDQSVNVRYYARKACDLFGEILNEQAREKELENELEKKKSAQAAVYARIVELLNSESPEDRMLAAKAAVKTRVNIFLDIILKKIESETDESVLGAFIKAVGHSEDKSYTPILIKYLKHPNIEIVLSAIEALALLGDVRAFPYIISVLYSNENENETITAAITGYLTNYPPEKIHLFLVEMLGYPSENMVEAALMAIYAFRCKKSAEYIKKLKSHRNETISARAEEALCEIEKNGLDDFNFTVFIGNLISAFEAGQPPEEAKKQEQKRGESESKIDELRELISKSSPSAEARISELLKNETDVRVLGYAISACRSVKGAKNLALLKKFLSHPDDRIRANAIEVLGETEGVDLHNMLKPFLADENNRVRANAIIALKNYPDIDHVALLKQMAEDDRNRLMAVSAVYAIMQIKGDSVELLRALAKDRNEEIKVRALSALEFLAGDSKNMAAKNILGELKSAPQKSRKAAAYIFDKSTMGGGGKKRIQKPAASVYLVNRLALLFRAFVHVLAVLLLAASALFVYKEFNSQTPKSAVNPIGVIANVFKANESDSKIVLLYTSNLAEVLSVPGPAGASKKSKLKEIISKERENALKESSVFLAFDLGNYSSTKINPADNTEDVYETLNELGYTAASFAARDALFCFNLLSAKDEKFKLPVVSSNLINNSSKEVPGIFKTYIEQDFNGLSVKTLALADSALVSKMPSNLSASYSVKDPLTSIAGFFSGDNSGKKVLKILLSSNAGALSDELAAKKIGADIIIDMGHGPDVSLLTAYKKAGDAYILPSKIKKNSAYMGRFEFIFESSSKSIGEFCKWRLSEL
ncbi:MAG: putative lyase [bacterium ADurb.Bin243]|nr:MAG: putative lyase [bacterium ADurb.Bin243]